MTDASLVKLHDVVADRVQGPIPKNFITPIRDITAVTLSELEAEAIEFEEVPAIENS